MKELEQKKRCSKCNQWKAVTEFHKRLNSKDGLYCYCRCCESQKAKEKYQRNKDKILLKQKKNKKGSWGAKATEYFHEIHGLSAEEISIDLLKAKIKQLKLTAKLKKKELKPMSKKIQRAIYINENEHKEILEHAKKQHMNFSSYCIHAAKEKMEREKKELKNVSRTNNSRSLLGL